MKVYTCKKTGQKFTEQEMVQRRQEKLKRQMRAKLVAGMFIGALVTLVAVAFFSPQVGAFDAQFKDMQTIEVRMLPGQTVWDIVEELTPNHSTREVVFAMRSMNEDIVLEEAKAYSDIITFFIDDTVDLSTLNHLDIYSTTCSR